MKSHSIKTEQLFYTACGAVGIGLFSLYNTFHPSPNDLQAQADIFHQPVASAIGALIAVIFPLPLLYWTIGVQARRRLLRNKRYNLTWQTILENDSEVRDAVNRLSLLSQKNVDEYRLFMLQQGDVSRSKEFEHEVIRRLQGSAFADDAVLREAYIKLNQEDVRFGDELIRVAGLVGKPKDLEEAVARIREKPLSQLQRRPDNDKIFGVGKLAVAWTAFIACAFVVSVAARVLPAWLEQRKAEVQWPGTPFIDPDDLMRAGRAKSPRCNSYPDVMTDDEFKRFWRECVD